MPPRSPLPHANLCTCQRQHGFMELRFNRRYPRCLIPKRYSPYRRRPALTVPLEIQRMIIREAIRDRTTTFQDYASYLCVCKSWCVLVKKDMRMARPIKKQYEIIRERFIRAR